MNDVERSVVLLRSPSYAMSFNVQVGPALNTFMSMDTEDERLKRSPNPLAELLVASVPLLILSRS